LLLLSRDIRRPHDADFPGLPGAFPVAVVNGPPSWRVIGLRPRLGEASCASCRGRTNPALNWRQQFIGIVEYPRNEVLRAKILGRRSGIN